MLLQAVDRLITKLASSTLRIVELEVPQSHGKYNHSHANLVHRRNGYWDIIIKTAYLSLRVSCSRFHVLYQRK